MPKTTKKKPMGKAVAAALKAMQNMVFRTADDLDVQLRQMRETLNAAGIIINVGSIVYAGRNSSGSGVVQIDADLAGAFASEWPEWAYGVAEGAVHSNKQVLVVYTDVPTGANMLLVGCLSWPVTGA